MLTQSEAFEMLLRINKDSARPPIGIMPYEEGWEALLVWQEMQPGFPARACRYEIRHDCQPEGCKMEDCDIARPCFECDDSGTACDSCKHS